MTNTVVMPTSRCRSEIDSLICTRSLASRLDSGGHREVDYCALVPVIEGAGGVITDWNGQPLTIRSGSSVVAAGDRRRHADALSLLRDG